MHGEVFSTNHLAMYCISQNLRKKGEWMIIFFFLWFCSYPGLDLNSARRKNATRETTSALKAWLYEHRKNPYPTKAEKIMLAIITKMTLTQVSTWFANARRRLKKECKVGWSASDKDDDKDSKDLNESDGYSSKDESEDRTHEGSYHVFNLSFSKLYKPKWVTYWFSLTWANS